MHFKVLLIIVRYINNVMLSAVSLPPSAPQVVSGNERSMAIRWNAPIDDGGAPITGYHVEARTQGFLLTDIISLDTKLISLLNLEINEGNINNDIIINT